MTKVTINPSTPAQQAVAKAVASVVVVDGGGRSIALRKPGVLAQYRFVEAVGAAAAGNETYMGMAMPLIYVAEIDGDPVAPPTRKSEVEALIQRLDEDGINAVMEGIKEHFGGPRDPEADKAALKN